MAGKKKNMYKKGDIIEDHNQTIEREIVKVLKNSYVWKYLDHPDIFYSRESCDPKLNVEWRLKKSDKLIVN